MGSGIAEKYIPKALSILLIIITALTLPIYLN